ncbi:hypothetical protein JW935_21455 [candidate division KSB1 bacterium]|nr:hypothetical protein [candidate division KSB1 bacterium]
MYRVWLNDTEISVYQPRTLDPPFAGQYDYGGDYAFVSFDCDGPVSIKITSFYFCQSTRNQRTIQGRCRCQILRHWYSHPDQYRVALSRDTISHWWGNRQSPFAYHRFECSNLRARYSGLERLDMVREKAHDAKC